MKINNNKHIKKYTTAYFDKNPKPRNIPNKTKLLKFCSFLIFIISLRDRVQNSNKKISVLIINDENETAGINKKTKQPLNESLGFKPELFSSLYTLHPTNK